MRHLRLILSLMLVAFVAGGVLVENHTSVTLTAGRFVPSRAPTHLLGPAVPGAAPSAKGAWAVQGVKLHDTGQDISALLNYWGNHYHVAPYELAAVAATESGLNARSDRYGYGADVSHGLLQFTDQTAIGDGVCRDDASCIAYLTPANSIRMGAQYLALIKHLIGYSFPRAYLGYNAGPYLGYHAYFYTHPTGSAYYAYTQNFLPNRAYVMAHYLRRTDGVGPKTGTGYPYLDSLAAQERLWHFPCTSALIESAYSYESSLIEYATPVADQDLETCGTPGYIVRLPGKAYDLYAVIGVVFVSGSGWVLELRTPNGGHLSLLHLESVNYGAASAPKLSYSGPTRKDLDDATGLAVGTTHTQTALPQAIILHGGQAVGLVGYPTDPIYGNGSVGPPNSQLCQLTDTAGENWLLRLAEGIDPNPHPKPKLPKFHLKLWDTYTHAHHKKSVPAYHKKHLRPAARFWLTHRALGYVMHEQVWHKKGGFESMSFTKKTLRFYPKRGKFVVVKR